MMRIFTRSVNVKNTTTTTYKYYFSEEISSLSISATCSTAKFNAWVTSVPTSHTANDEEGGGEDGVFLYPARVL